MISLLILATWIGFGIVAALADSDEHRRQSIPMAMFLGPLWLAVSLDRRSLALATVDLTDPPRASPRRRAPDPSATASS